MPRMAPVPFRWRSRLSPDAMPAYELTVELRSANGELLDTRRDYFLVSDAVEELIDAAEDLQEAADDLEKAAGEPPRHHWWQNL